MEGFKASVQNFEQELLEKQDNFGEMMVEFNKALNGKTFDSKYNSFVGSFQQFTNEMKYQIQTGNLDQVLKFADEKFNTGKISK